MVQMHELSCLNTGEMRTVQDKLINKLDYLSDEDKLLIYHTATFVIAKYRAASVPRRDGGEQAYDHPLATAEILAGWKLPAVYIQEGLLHDTVEDAGVTVDELRDIFGDDIAEGVDRLGILKKYDKTAQERGITSDIDRDQELRALFFESLIDHPSVVLVRTAERLHNLETIEPRIKKNKLSAERTAKESLTVYLPFLWDLGMHDVANSYAEYALGVTHSDEMKDIDNALPALRKEMSEVRETLANILGFDTKKLDENPLDIPGIRATKLNVYPPSYKDLADLLEKRRYFQDIAAEEVPYLADIVCDNIGEVGAYAATLVHSGLFHYDERSIERLWQDIAKPDDNRQYSLMLIPKTPKIIKPSPIKISFLNEDMLIRRQGSILHLHQKGDIDERLKAAAESRVRELKDRLMRVSQSAPRLPKRADLYLSEVRQDTMMVNYRVNGEDETKSVHVRKRSSVMDVLLEVLTPAQLICCKAVRIKGKIPLLDHVVSKFSQLDIEIDEKEIFLDPSWLDAFRQAKEEKIDIVKKSLRSVVDNNQIDVGNGNFVGYDQEYKERILDAARARAMDNIERKYRGERGSALRLEVTSGFDEELRNSYGYDREKFLIDAGIGTVSERKIDIVVRNLVDIRESRLIPITLYVPIGQDQPGWQSVFAAVISEAGMNMKVLDGGSSNDPGMEMFITYWCELPKNLQSETLPALLETVKKSVLANCRKEFSLPDDPPLIYEIPPGLRVKDS